MNDITIDNSIILDSSTQNMSLLFSHGGRDFSTISIRVDDRYVSMYIPNDALPALMKEMQKALDNSGPTY